MAKHILVLTGSPRKGGNSDKLADAFIAGAQQFTFPMQLKAAIDKFYSFIIGKRPLAVKECALLVCGGGTEVAVFDGIVKSYQLIAEFLGWKDSGVILVPGLHGKDEILETDGLQRAELLGKSLV